MGSTCLCNEDPKFGGRASREHGGDLGGFPSTLETNLGAGRFVPGLLLRISINHLPCDHVGSWTSSTNSVKSDSLLASHLYAKEIVGQRLNGSS